MVDSMELTDTGSRRVVERVSVLDSAPGQSTAAFRAMTKRGFWRALATAAQTRLPRSLGSSLLNLRLVLRLRLRDFLPGWRAPRLPRRAGEDPAPIGTPSCCLESEPVAPPC